MVRRVSRRNYRSKRVRRRGSRSLRKRVKSRRTRSLRSRRSLRRRRMRGGAKFKVDDIVQVNVEWPSLGLEKGDVCIISRVFSVAHWTDDDGKVLSSFQQYGIKKDGKGKSIKMNEEYLEEAN